jgi:uncharacterized membrane protein YozB (DUF420 family)
MKVQDMPTLNAVLNGICTVLLIIGWVLIRRKQRDAHRAIMLTAFVVSLAFLACYLYYHFQVGSVKFTGHGPVRFVYFTVLISHTILAMVVAPMVLITLSRGLAKKFDKHKRIAKWTLPIWLYVSVTGVLVYLMLYQWFPSA